MIHNFVHFFFRFSFCFKTPIRNHLLSDSFSLQLHQISEFYHSVNLSMSEVPYALSHYLLYGKFPLPQFPHESPSEVDFSSITRIQVTNSTRPPSVISSITPYLVHKIWYNQYQITLNKPPETPSPN